MPDLTKNSTGCVQDIELSKETINNVLARYDQNGYPRKFKRWKFFYTEVPDTLSRARRS